MLTFSRWGIMSEAFNLTRRPPRNWKGRDLGLKLVYGIPQREEGAKLFLEWAHPTLLLVRAPCSKAREYASQTFIQPCMWFCAVWPMENWLASSLDQIQGWTTVQDFLLSCFRARTSAPGAAVPIFVKWQSPSMGSMEGEGGDRGRKI